MQNDRSYRTLSAQRTPFAFWMLGGLLVIYVACCTGFRDNVWESDAWEHHRAIVALTHNLLHPGNPTFAVATPSIRYSPYIITLALISRVAHIDPYNVLSAAAVFNTILLVVGLWLVLKQYGESASAAAVLLVMIALYGGAPGYAGSYALADLPVHQVNPSAFSFGLTLCAIALSRQIQALSGRTWLWAALIPLLGITFLDHAMTGAFTAVVLLAFAAHAPDRVRDRMLLGTLGVIVLTLALCMLWPWYSFKTALFSNPDRAYWFNRGILILMLSQWCAPAIVLGLMAFPLRGRELVRRSLVGAGVCFAAAILSFALHSPALARFPMPGLVLLHIPIGIFVYENGLLRLSTWSRRFHAMREPHADHAIMETIAAMILLYCLVPMALAVVREPYLARPYFATLLKQDKQLNLRARYAHLLENVGASDVVLSDARTAWPVPSIHGRIVSALHYEFFVHGQPQRDQDVEQFFSTATAIERESILRKYDVRWIILNLDQSPLDVCREVAENHAVVRQDAQLVLLDARPAPTAQVSR